MSLCLQVFAVIFLWFFSIFGLFVLSYSVLFAFNFLDACLFSNEKEQEQMLI